MPSPPPGTLSPRSRLSAALSPRPLTGFALKVDTNVSYPDAGPYATIRFEPFAPACVQRGSPGTLVSLGSPSGAPITRSTAAEGTIEHTSGSPFASSPPAPSSPAAASDATASLPADG